MEYLYLLLAVAFYFPLILAAKLGSEATGEKGAMFKYCFYRALIGIPLGLIGVVFTGSKIHLDLYTVLISLMFGLTLALVGLITLYSMRVTTVAISMVFSSASVVIPCVFGAVFFDEPITFVNGIGFVLFLASVYLIASKSQVKKLKFGIKALLVCIGVMFVNGFGATSIQLFGKCVPDGEKSVFMFIAYCVQAVIMSVVYLSYSVKNNTQKIVSMSKKMWIYGGANIVATFLIQRITAELSSDISALVIFPVTNGGSVIMGVIVGWLCFKEKLTVKNMVGIIVCIISLMLINLF